MSQSLEICEGLEEWSGQQYLSNCSDTEEEEGNQLVSGGVRASEPQPVILPCFPHWITHLSCPCLSEFPYLSLGNEEMPQPRFLEIILIKVADRALSHSLQQSEITAARYEMQLNKISFSLCHSLQENTKPLQTARGGDQRTCW